MWHVKVAIPADVQHVFGKRAFKEALKTSNKSDAITKSLPIVAGYKDAIAEARGNPTQHLNDYLRHTKEFLSSALKSGQADQDAIACIEQEVLAALVKSYCVTNAEDLSAEASEEVRKAFKITTGQRTLFEGPLEDYARSRRVEPKTETIDRHAISV